MHRCLAVCLCLLPLWGEDPPARVGETQLATGQGVKPAGQLLLQAGRPLDLVLSEDGETACVQNGTNLLLVDVKTWTLRQILPYGKGHGAPHGMVRVGSSLWISQARGHLQEVRLGGTHAVLGRRIALPGADRDTPLPCGLAVTADGKGLVVALSRRNSLGVVDLEKGTLLREIPVGVAPYGVVVEGSRAFVTNWGGRQAPKGERVMASSGTDVRVDAKGFPLGGTLSEVDLASERQVREAAVGLHPSRILLDRGRLFVANANGDSVSILDATSLAVRETVNVKPDAALPFGSIPNALVLSPDGQTLFVANAGNNAVAVVALNGKTRLEGFIPAGWFPSALATDGKHLYIASAKGDGSRDPRASN